MVLNSSAAIWMIFLKCLKIKIFLLLLGTLTCNLKDQKPFVSVKDDNNPPAEDVY